MWWTVFSIVEFILGYTNTTKFSKTQKKILPDPPCRENPTKKNTMLFTCVAVLALSADPPAPVWADQFQVPIVQTIVSMDITHVNTIMYYYDAVNNVSRQDHSRGQYDEFCRKEHEFSDQPCSQLVSYDGWRYMMFPEEGSCCKLCNRTVGCGIIAKDWLKDAPYQGQLVVNGSLCNGWMQQGGEKNYYYATADEKQTPCYYYEGYPTLALGINQWNYTMSQYKEGPVDKSYFTLPSECENAKMCKGM